MFSPDKETAMINRIFVIALSVSSLVAMLMFAQKTGFDPSGQARYTAPSPAPVFLTKTHHSVPPPFL